MGTIVQLNKSDQEVIFLTQSLEDVKGKIRHIDPRLLGEKRHYEENDHWKVTKKVYDFFFFIKGLLFFGTIKRLEESKKSFETDLEVLKQKIDPIDSTASPFSQLTISEKEKAKMREFLPIIVYEDASILIAKIDTLKEANKKLKSLHPLKSFEFILNDPTLRKCVIDLSQKPERWIGLKVWGVSVAQGFKAQRAKKLEMAHSQGTILPCLPEFAKSIGLTVEQLSRITSLAKQGKWEDFIQSLVEFAGHEQEIQPVDSHVSPFARLTISEEEKEKLRIFIPMVANDSIPTLISKLGTLLDAKKKLHSLHPLKSFEFMLNDPALRECICRISKNSQRWIGVWVAKGFKPQTAEKLQEYHAQGAVIPCLPEFAKSIGLTEQQELKISSLAEQGQWEEMLQALVDFYN